MLARTGMHRLNVKHRIPDPASDRLARTLSRIKGTAGAAAESHRRSQLAQKKLPLLAGLARTLRIVVGICLIDLLLEVQQSSPVVCSRHGIECLSYIALHSEVEVTPSGGTSPAANSPSMRKIHGGYFCAWRA